MMMVDDAREMEDRMSAIWYSIHLLTEKIFANKSVFDYILERFEKWYIGGMLHWFKCANYNIVVQREDGV